MWPGFGENSRVLKWVVERVSGKVDAQETPIGWVPKAVDLDLEGLSVRDEVMQQLLDVDVEQWQAEAESIRQHFGNYGSKMPDELYRQLDALEARLHEKK